MSSVNRVVLRITCLLGCLVMLLGMPAYSGPIDKGVWYQFSFAGIGSQATGCDPADPAGGFCIPSSGTPTQFLDAPPWTFNVTFSGLLTVTDTFLSGDRFEVFDNGVSLGLTSAVAPDVDCGDDPVPCLSNPAISSGVFTLVAGPHSITITANEALEGGGSGYLRLDDVPEPATSLLTVLGITALLGVTRRRRLVRR